VTLRVIGQRSDRHCLDWRPSWCERQGSVALMRGDQPVPSGGIARSTEWGFITFRTAW